MVLTLTVFLPLSAGAEGKVYTKKMHLSDFTTKTTKVVLSGGAILDAALKSEVTRCWQISPYEFCSASEYEALKEKSDYYFLHFVNNISSEGVNDGIISLSLVKGGKEKSQDPSQRRVEIITIPVAPAEFSTGREFIYLGAFLEIIQDYVEDAMQADVKAYAGLGNYNSRLATGQRRKIWLSEDDLGFEPTEAQIRAMGGEKVLLRTARQWLETVEKRWGVRPILYVSQSFINRHLSSTDVKTDAWHIKTNYNIWIARYGEYKPDVHLIFWQLSPDGRVAGIKTPVDINIFNGYATAFKKTFAKE